MKLRVGDTAEFSKTITDEDVNAFADLTGDYNPVHLDDTYASGTRFGRRIAHGMLTASLISSVLANRLPGEGTVYLSQSLKFVAPVFLNDTVTARVTVTGIREDKPVATLETLCVNQRGEPLVKGEAVVLFAVE
jgi:acyl dehydratase